MAHGSWFVCEVTLMYALVNLTSGLFFPSSFENSQNFEAQNIEVYEIDKGELELFYMCIPLIHPT
jgi:hypothetical protein